MLRKSATIFFILVFGLCALAQSTQQVFIDGKYNLKQGNYSEAITQFASLASDATFGAYATFYLGLSYYKAEANQNALDAWRQLEEKYPGFDQKAELNFWLTKAYFAVKNYTRAVQLAQRIEDPVLKYETYLSELSGVSFVELRNLYASYPEDLELAKVIVKIGMGRELSEKDTFFLNGVQALHNIQASSFGDFPIIFKESYTVGVMLPFLFDDLTRTERIMRNELVMDIYQGMLLAQEFLAEKEVNLTLYPYDTRRDSLHTETLLRNKSLKKMDVLVGPLYAEPIEIVNRFSSENKIPMVNPISSNAMVLGDNPYALIWRPTYETMALKTADYMFATSTKFEANIYFEDTSTERLFAQTYKRRLEELGMVITDYRPIDNRTAREVLAQFTDQEELVLRLSDEEAALEREAGRPIRDRQVYDASGKLITKEDGTPKLEYYELVFTADTDSLDHILALTRSNLLANNFVGAVESISDTVRLVGMGEWLDFSMLDYRQLDRLQVNLIDPNYVNRKTEFFALIESRFQQKFKKKPNQYNLSGFETIWWVGNMMKRYGKYFQNGLLDEPDFPSLFYGFQFAAGKRDNQVVPILRFVEDELRTVNQVTNLEAESDEERTDEGGK